MDIPNAGTSRSLIQGSELGIISSLEAIRAEQEGEFFNLVDSVVVGFKKSRKQGRVSLHELNEWVMNLEE